MSTTMTAGNAPPGSGALFRLKQKQQMETVRLMQAQQAQRYALQSGLLTSMPAAVTRDDQPYQPRPPPMAPMEASNTRNTSSSHSHIDQDALLPNECNVTTQPNEFDPEAHGISDASPDSSGESIPTYRNNFDAASPEEKPISPAIRSDTSGQNDFESFVERELSKVEANPRSVSKQSITPTKRPFLRKGQGLSRFKNGGLANRPSATDQSSTTTSANSQKNPEWGSILARRNGEKQRHHKLHVPSYHDGDQMSETSSHISPSMWDMREQDEKRELEEFRFLELAAAASRSLKGSPERQSHDPHVMESTSKHTVDEQDKFLAHEYDNDDDRRRWDNEHRNMNSSTAFRDEDDNHPKPAPMSSSFDDEASWSDNTINGDSVDTATNVHNNIDTDTNSSSPNELNENHASDTAFYRVNPVPASPPPRSKLVSKLFDNKPRLRQNQNTNAKLRSRRQPSSPKTRSSGQVHYEDNSSAGDQMVRTEDNAAADLSVEDRIGALEQEIAKFKAENLRIAALREAQEKEIKKMRTEEVSFRRKMELQQKEFEQYRREELQKMNREKKVWDKHYKAAREMPNRKERSEIEALRGELAALTQTMVDTEKRNKLNTARLNDRIKQLTEKNHELTEEVRELERLRLNAWEASNATTTHTAGSPPRSKVRQMQSKPPSSPSRVTITQHKSPRQSPARSDIIVKNSHIPRNGEVPDAMPITTITGPPVGELGSLDDSPGHEVEREHSSEEIVISNHPDGKIEKLFPNGTKLITFGDGSRKEVYADGHTVVRFYNGDIKQTFPNDQVVYFYAEAQTTHTTFPDGLEVLEFANGQTEKNYPDGTQEIGFPDKTKKYIFSNGEEETVFADGTVQRLTANGERVIEYPNGQREIHTANYRKRRYPNGTVKIVYPDGRQETKYASGRVRVKDKNGVVIVDTHAGKEVSSS